MKPCLSWASAAIFWIQIQIDPQEKIQIRNRPSRKVQILIDPQEKEILDQAKNKTRNKKSYFIKIFGQKILNKRSIIAFLKLDPDSKLCL